MQPAFLVMAVAITVGAFALAAVGAQAAMDDLTPEAGVARFMPGLGWGSILVGGGLAATLGVGATSVHVLRTKWLPAWFGWFGVVCAVLLLGAVIFLPMVALPVWTLVASLLLATDKSAAREADAVA